MCISFTIAKRDNEILEIIQNFSNEKWFELIEKYPQLSGMEKPEIIVIFKDGHITVS